MGKYHITTVLKIIDDPKSSKWTDISLDSVVPTFSGVGVVGFSLNLVVGGGPTVEGILSPAEFKR